jgi:hypothetical protein
LRNLVGIETTERVEESVNSIRFKSLAPLQKFYAG